MTTLFPADKMVYGIGTDIIVEVTGVKSTKAVRQRLAQSLGVTIRKFFPNAKVESFVYIDNPERTHSGLLNKTKQRQNSMKTG